MGLNEDHDLTPMGEARRQRPKEPIVIIRAEGFGRGKIEPKLHGGRNLVDILSTGAAGGQKLLLELAFDALDQTRHGLTPRD